VGKIIWSRYFRGRLAEYLFCTGDYYHYQLRFVERILLAESY